MLKVISTAMVAATLVACDVGPIDPTPQPTPVRTTYPARYTGTIKMTETRGSGRDATVSNWVFNAVFVRSSPTDATVGDYDLQTLSLMGTQVISMSGAAGTTQTCTTSGPGSATLAIGALSVTEPSTNHFSFGGSVSWTGDGTETCGTMTNPRLGFSVASAAPQAPSSSPCTSTLGTLVPLTGGNALLTYREQLQCADGAVPIDRTEDWSLTGS